MKKMKHYLLLLTALLVSGGVWGLMPIEPQRLVKPNVIEVIEEQTPFSIDQVSLSKEELPLSKTETSQVEELPVLILPDMDRLPSVAREESKLPRRATNEGEDVAALYDAGGQLVQNYTTIAAAITAASDGQTVKLLTSVSQASPITINKAITFDLNGCSFTFTANDYNAVIVNPGAGKTVTIDGYNDDFSKKGSINHSYNTSQADAIYFYSGSLVINGCDFTSKSYGYTLYCAGTATSMSISNSTISGGRFGLVNGKMSSVNIGENVSIGGSTYGLYSVKANAVITTSSALTNVCTNGVATTFTVNSGCSIATATWALGGATTFNNNGTLELNKNVSYALTINNTGSCSITNGNYTKDITVDNQGTFNISGGQLSADFVLGSGQSCVVTGGTFAVGTQQKPLAYDRIKDFIASGKKSMASYVTSGAAMQVVDNSYTAEASYNSTEYATLNAAVAAALANTQDPNPEVVLQKDVAINEILTISGTMTLNIGSHNISGSSYIKLTKGDFTIKGSGTIQTTNASSPIWLYASSNTANLDVQGSVSITGVKYGIYNYYNVKNVNIASTVSVSGGTYDIYNYADCENFINHSSANIVCSGYYIGDITSDGGGSVLIKSGTKIKASLYAKLSGYIESGYKGFLQKNATYGDIYWVEANTKAVLAKIGDYEYFTLSDAITAAQTDDEIDLASDNSLTSALTVSKKITIDLNGFNLSTSYSQGIKVSNNLTIKNSKQTGKLTTTGAQAGLWLNANATLTLQDVVADLGSVSYAAILLYGANSTFVANNSTINIAAGAYYGFWDYSGSGVVNLNNSTILSAEGVLAMGGGSVTSTNTNITCTETAKTQTFGINLENGSSLVFNSGNLIVSNPTSDFSVGVALWDDSTSVTIKGGHIEASAFAVAGNGSGTTNSLITITDGELVSDGAGIYHPQTGTLNISGGTITGDLTAIEMRSGTLNIDGGTFTSTRGTLLCAPNNSGTTTAGAAISIAQHATLNEIVVTINGGTFNGQMALVQLNPQDNSELDYKKMIVNVNGGSFWSSNIKDSTLLNDSKFGNIAYMSTDMFISQNRRIFLRGGYYNNDPVNFVAAGYQRIKLADIPEAQRSPEDLAAIAANYVYKIGVIYPEDAVTTTECTNCPNWKEDAALLWSDGEVPTGSTPVVIADKEVIITTPADAYSIQLDTVGSGGTAKLTIKDGGMLMVGAGGVFGATKVNFIVEDGGMLCISPSAEEYENPDGTVIVSSDYARRKDAAADAKELGDLTNDDLYWRHIACPTVNDDRDLTLSQTGKTYVSTWNLKNGWQSKSANDWKTPFVGYSISTILSSTTRDEDTVLYTFKGKLAGNKVDPLKFANSGFTFFGNSYLAPIDIRELLTSLDVNSDVESSVILYRYVNDEYEYINWAAFAIPTTQADIDPLQGFFIFSAEPSSVEYNYTKAVWDAFCAKARVVEFGSGAPARKQSKASDFDAIACVQLTSNNGKHDKVYLFEGADYSDMFDKGYDARKMNVDGFHIAALGANNELAIIATDNLEGTALTFTTNNATQYALSFSNVSGKALAIYDALTGITTNMTEGAIYNFTADANTSMDNRFQVINAHKMPTDLVESNASVAVKGVYTVLGEYLGEGNIWLTLPSGVYIVNGEKMIR